MLIYPKYYNFIVQKISMIEPIITQGLNRMAFKNQQAMIELQNNLNTGGGGSVDRLELFLSGLMDRMAQKQEEAAKDIVERVQREIDPPKLVEAIGRGVVEKQKDGVDQLVGNFNAGVIKENYNQNAIVGNNPLPLELGMMMENQINQIFFPFLTPELILNRFEIDEIFTFEKIAQELVDFTLQRDSNMKDQFQKPKAPRGALNLGQAIAGKIIKQQYKPKKPKKSKITEQFKQALTDPNFKLPQNRQQQQLGRSAQLTTPNPQTEYQPEMTSLQISTQKNIRAEDQDAHARRRVESESKTNALMYSPVQNNSKVYRIGKESIRKHSLKREKQAQSQMMANIDFLRRMRGTLSMETPKKQWKQETSKIRGTLQQVKQAKKKQMQQLGFSDASRVLQSKLMVSSEGYSPQRSDLLPEIRQTTKKKGQVFKPAAFSVYTIQKDNEIFYNKFTK